MPDLTPILQEPIAESSLPLKAVESDFAVDASGFAMSNLVRWQNARHGRGQDKHGWIKCHLMVGVKTNDESTFAAIKAKSGGRLRSKTETAQTNEVPLKILCHNVCCVIRSMHELGLEPAFWAEDDPAPKLF